MRLWRFTDVIGMDPVFRQPQQEYGHRANKSSKGPVNLRGNIVEASVKDLQKMGGSAIQVWKAYSAVEWWSNRRKVASSGGAKMMRMTGALGLEQRDPLPAEHSWTGSPPYTACFTRLCCILSHGRSDLTVCWKSFGPKYGRPKWNSIAHYCHWHERCTILTMLQPTAAARPQNHVCLMEI